MSRLFSIPLFAILLGCMSSLGCNTINEPIENDPWVIRTNFSDDDKWKKVCDLIASPQQAVGMKFFAHVHYVTDEKHRNKEVVDLISSLPDDYQEMFCFVVDRECIESVEHSILVVGFYPSGDESFDRLPRDTPPNDIVTFRALPSQIQAIENNLSIANMGFEEFADSTDADGVYRGFPQ